MSQRLFRLDSDHSTLLLLSIDKAIPAIIYYGVKLGTELDTYLATFISADAIPMAKLDVRSQISLLPENSRGFFGEPGLQGHRNGKHFAHQFILNEVKESKASLEFNVGDESTNLELIISISCDFESNVFSWKNHLTNKGNDEFTLMNLSCPTIPLELSLNIITSLHGRWGKEFQQQQTSLESARFQIENRRGRTSHENFPGIFLGDSFTNELSGLSFAAHLGWSGNYRLIIDSLSEHERYLQASEILIAGEIILSNQESYTTPVLYTTQTDIGHSKSSQNFHQFARKHILPKWTRKERPVHSNSWEALYFDHNINKLKELVDAAYETGAERFILDDGWFMGRRDDTAGLGDWQIDSDIYPNGLHPLVDHVRSKGMQFGLWFEPEMVNPNSALFKDHPEWVLQHQPYPLIPARNQQVLDLSQPDLFNYLLEAISMLVDEYKIDYIKWDMNRDTLNAGSDLKASQHKQIKQVYRLISLLNKQHPELEIESCASGGARADFGILKHTGRIWASDNIDPIERISIQRGFTLFFPSEIMGSHIGSDIAHLTGRQTSLDTRAIVALQGQTGFEFDSRLLTDEQRKTVKHYTFIYKQNRKWLSDANLWRLPTVQKCIHTQGLVSENQSRSLWTIVTDGSHLHQNAGKVKFHGLNPKSDYQVTCLNKNIEYLAHFSKQLPPWMNSPEMIVKGELLTKIGLHLPYLAPQTALLLSCNEVND